VVYGSRKLSQTPRQTSAQNLKTMHNPRSDVAGEEVRAPSAPCLPNFLSYGLV
jgi:hypothetical protein